MTIKPIFGNYYLQKIAYCTKSINKNKLYSNTLFLPKTKFPLRLDGKKLKERNDRIYTVAEFDHLYTWQRSHLSEPEFVLHDGPPYANGKLHMGHAINKILKDTILRYAILKGNKVHYIPGWDCHGLPIELKALSQKDSDPIQIRQKARKFAESTIDDQKKSFKSWGILGDWNSCYATSSPDYYKVQFKIFYKLYNKKLIYRDFKPVYWSPSSRTALAEAELEYDENYKSPSAFVRLKLKKLPNLQIDSNLDIFGVIWTTTPWTLPSNQAVCFNPTFKYSLIKNTDNNDCYIIASDLIENVSKTLKRNFEILQTFPGEILSSSTYIHPIFKDKELKFYPSNHVTLSKGTGLVHTAPAHGPDDFLVGLNNNLSTVNLVDDSGCYLEQTGEEFAGKFVLTDGNTTVLKYLRDDLLHVEDFVHSYPCDWRTKQPVIIRASKQWFIDTNSIKRRAMELLDEVKIFPKSSSEIYKANLMKQIEKRPYWCISRQRKWGVPLPVFFNKINEEIIINEDIIRHLCGLIDKHGADFWWNLQIGQLLPNELHDSFDLNTITRGEDILDIWFDSGISWAKVLEGNKVADMYLEGIDQFNGWFQSSLITSVALRDKIPYKSLYIHGFAVDDHGRKMSKSLGNVIDPEEVIFGGKKQKAYGIDTLRWWVACHANQDSVASINENVLQSSADEIQKIRSVLRFALGCLEDYQISEIDYKSLPLIDRYILHLLHQFDEKAKEYIKDYQFHRICIGVINLLTNQISALYYTSIKDRLYCDLLDTEARRGAQFVLFQIFEIITQAVAPIVPFLIEEMYQYLPQKHNNTYFMSTHQKPQIIWNNPKIVELMEVILALKKQINKDASSDTIGLSVEIQFSNKVHKLIQEIIEIDRLQFELEDILQVAEVKINPNLIQDDFVVTVKKSQRFSCLRCRRVKSDCANDLCVRCKHVVNNVVEQSVVVN